MSSSEIERNTMIDLDTAVSQVRVKADIAAEDVKQLVNAAFENPERAYGVIRQLAAAGRIEKAIAMLAGDRTHWHFGAQKRAFLGLFASRDPDVKAAHARLPDALRQFGQIQSQLRSMVETRRKRIIDEDAAATALKRGMTDQPARKRGRKFAGSTD
jgi:hypothetical protein